MLGLEDRVWLVLPHKKRAAPSSVPSSHPVWWCKPICAVFPPCPSLVCPVLPPCSHSPVASAPVGISLCACTARRHRRAWAPAHQLTWPSTPISLQRLSSKNKKHIRRFSAGKKHRHALGCGFCLLAGLFQLRRERSAVESARALRPWSAWLGTAACAHKHVHAQGIGQRAPALPG